MKINPALQVFNQSIRIQIFVSNYLPTFFLYFYGITPLTPEPATAHSAAVVPRVNGSVGLP